MTVNKELLQRTMTEVLAHPELHAQITWAMKTECGTAYCFAGLVCHLSDLKPDWEVAIETISGGALQTSSLTSGELIQDAATRLLGVDHETAEELYSPFNTTADLKHYVDEICEHGLIREAQTTDPWSE